MFVYVQQCISDFILQIERLLIAFHLNRPVAHIQSCIGGSGAAANERQGSRVWGENYSYEWYKFHFLPHRDQNVHGVFPSLSVVLRISTISIVFLFLANCMTIYASRSHSLGGSVRVHYARCLVSVYEVCAVLCRAVSGAETEVYTFFNHFLDSKRRL